MFKQATEAGEITLREIKRKVLLACHRNLQKKKKKYEIKLK